MEQEAKKQETQKKSGLRKAMLPALAMLLASVLSLTTMTYAWFTSGTEATVGSFDLDVAAGGGLEISTTGAEGSWKSTITSEEIKALDGVKDYVSGTGSKQLYPRSTVGAIGEDGKIDFFEAVIDNTTKHQITSTSEKEDGFLTFNLYFRNAAEEKEIIIDGTTFKAGSGLDHYFSHYATRLAFVNAGSHNVNAVDPSFDNFEKSTTAKIFEPNAESHTQDAINDYRANGTEADHESFGGTGVLKYYGVAKAESSDPFDRYTEKAGVLTHVESITDEDDGAALKTTSFFTTISSSPFSAALKFSVKAAE